MAVIECNFALHLNAYSGIITKDITEEKVYFYGNHKNNKQNLDVTQLLFFNCNFLKMPKNIHESFPNLTELRLNSCKLKSIEREHVKNLTKLRQFFVFDCDLKKLKGDLFSDLKDLECISFFHNKLEEIDSTILDGLYRLNYADFRKNTNIDMMYDLKMDFSRKSLADLKLEIYNKCQPKKTMQAGPSKQQDMARSLPQCNQVNSENDKLLAEIKKLKTELKNANDTIQDLEIYTENQRKELSSLNAKQLRQVKALRESNKLSNENQNLKAENKNLRDTKQNLTAENKSLKDSNKNLKAEIQKLKNQISQQAQASTVIKNQNENLANASTSNSSHLLTENTILRKERENLKTENERLQNSLRKQETLIKNQRENITTLLANKQKDVNLNGIKRILADSAFKDFTFNVGESSFKVHKVLFAARSLTLAEIFKNNPELQELNLKDIPENVFNILHNYIYNNRLPEDTNFVEVMIAAHRLKIDDLTKEVAEILLEKVDEKNAYEVLVLSNKFGHEKLQQKAFEIIQTKIFPERKLDLELSKQPEKLKKLIDAKKKFDEEFQKLTELKENN